MTTTLYKIRVYKIWYDDCPEEFYIGSTKEKHLSERMTEHRKSCRRGKGANLYIRMREKGINEFKYVQIAWADVSSKEEQRQIEQTYMDQLKPTLNMVRAIRKEGTRQEYMKEYRQQHGRAEIDRERVRAIRKEGTRQEYMKEYSQQHGRAEIDRERSRAYRKSHKNMKTCICGSNYNYGKSCNRTKHYQSKKHQEYVKLIWEKLGGS